MAVTINGTTGVSVGTGSITFPDSSTQNTAATGFGFKNRIINGAMMIDQRNAGSSGTSVAYTVDRWYFDSSLSTKGTWQQNAGSVTPPTGFTNYLGFTSNSAYTLGSGDYFGFNQRIEGYNTFDLAWGTASAATVTLSFWVRSSLTGTFGGSVRNNAYNRTYVFTYTITSANTWQYVTIVIPGDQSGTWVTNNTIGLSVGLTCGVGSTYGTSSTNTWVSGNYNGPTGTVNVAGTSGATFYITGVQLEKGSTATSFDYRPYGTELDLCYRYFQKTYDIGVAPGTATRSGLIGAVYYSSANYGTPFNLKSEMRTAPTLSYWDGAGNASRVSYYAASWSDNNNFISSFLAISTKSIVAVPNNTITASLMIHYTASAEL